MKKETLLLPFIIALTSCALFRSTAKTVIDVAIATCVAEHPEINDEKTMRETCQYLEEYGPLVRDLLGARKRGLARVAAQRVDPDFDGGAKDASE